MLRSICLWIVAGLVTAWLTGKIMEGNEHGACVDIVIGITDTLIGRFAMQFLGSRPG